MKFTDLPDWFTVWFSDKRSLLATMVRNLSADLDAGRDYFGDSATRQREEIEACQKQFESELDGFNGMSPEEISHWCYRDLLRRGAIG